MDIDKDKLGNIEYGLKIAEQLKEKFIGSKVIDLKYDYYSEGFYIELDNGEKLNITV
jgi:hypothetical protein